MFFDFFEIFQNFWNFSLFVKFSKIFRNFLKFLEKSRRPIRRPTRRPLRPGDGEAKLQKKGRRKKKKTGRKIPVSNPLSFAHPGKKYAVRANPSLRYDEISGKIGHGHFSSATNRVARAPDWPIFCRNFSSVFTHLVAKLGRKGGPREASNSNFPELGQHFLGKWVIN